MVLKILILLYVYVWVPLKLDVQTGVSHHVGAENSNSKPLKEQSVPLNSEPSGQLHHDSFLLVNPRPACPQPMQLKVPPCSSVSSVFLFCVFFERMS